MIAECEKGEIIDGKVEKYFKFKLANARTGRMYKGYVTLCYYGMEGQEIYIGLAFCSPLDEYDERKGKLIAKGRAISPRTGYRFFNTTACVHYDIASIIEWICINTNTPIPWIPFGVNLKVVGWKDIS